MPTNHVFVEALPVDEIQLVATAILNRQFSTALIKPAWVVAEYAVTRFTPSHVVGGAGPHYQADEDDAMRLLLTLAEPERQPKLVITPLAWVAIVKTILGAILSAL